MIFNLKTNVSKLMSEQGYNVIGGGVVLYHLKLILKTPIYIDIRIRDRYGI